MLQQSMTSSTRHVILYFFTREPWPFLFERHNDTKMQLVYISLKDRKDTKNAIYLQFSEKRNMKLCVMPCVKKSLLYTFIRPFTTQYSRYSQLAAAKYI